MRKRFASFLLCFFMCVALIPVSAQATETPVATPPTIPTEGDVWDGSITQPTKLVQKDGVYYYEITKCSELAYVAQTGGDWLTYNYILGNNLIMNDVEFTWDDEGTLTNSEDEIAALNEWIPIGNTPGNSSLQYRGCFNGNDYQISGLYVLNPSKWGTGLFGVASNGSVRNVTVVNAYIVGSRTVAGIVGYASGITVTDCVFSGLAMATDSDTWQDGVGGIVAYGAHADTSFCTNYGTVIAKGNCAGGIVGEGSAEHSTNFGAISATGTHCGGIVGEGSASFCENVGNISGQDYVGGISGYSYRNGTISSCANAGYVNGNAFVGGIIGYTNDDVINVYNSAVICGTNSVGGIIGKAENAKIQNVYNMSAVSSLGENVGGLVGNSDHIWGRSTLSHNYYIASDAYFGCGNLQEDTAGQFEAKTAVELQSKETYRDWDFSSVWAITSDKNGGYPYLQWQESSLSNIPTNGISLSDTTLDLSVGDYTYLTATVSPANASNQAVTWKSSDADIATVSTAGKLTAVSAGTATITATTVDGGYTATCTVTVTERLPEEYKINSISVRDNDGATLSALPNGTCLATVSITNLASEGNTLVFLAAYSPTGQYQGMMWVCVEDLPVGATIKVTLPVDNSDGKIENLKAFTVASFFNLAPLSEAVSFLT